MRTIKLGELHVACNRIIAHLMLNATGSLTQGCCPNTDINSKRLHPRLALE